MGRLRSNGYTSHRLAPADGGCAVSRRGNVRVGEAWHAAYVITRGRSRSDTMRLLVCFHEVIGLFVHEEEKMVFPPLQPNNDSP